MGSQRFCLRWNNHQSNLLSVFDQLLHDEAFVDVTLAVEGQFLRAHKMVLSACSPYFQALFVGHPDKHPIVILKDVPFADMRSLLDFMYRGEVSVDQDRLTAFLKVAESLRIKGLTEVNEERCDLPSIANSLLNQSLPPPPPPNLHRISQLHHHHQLQQQHYHQPQSTQVSQQGQQQHQSSQNNKRLAPPHPYQIQSAMLNSALTAPKRKRGRPRKLSGSNPGTPNPHASDDQDDVRTNNIDNHLEASEGKNGPSVLGSNHCSSPRESGGSGGEESCAAPPSAAATGSVTVETEGGGANDQQPGSPSSPHETLIIKPEIVKRELALNRTEGSIEDQDDAMDASDTEHDETDEYNCVKTEQDGPKPSTSGQDIIPPYHGATSDGIERFAGPKIEPGEDDCGTDDEESQHSDFTGCYEDMIACSPASSDAEEDGYQRSSKYSSKLTAENMDEDISQYEHDSLATLLSQQNKSAPSSPSAGGYTGPVEQSSKPISTSSSTQRNRRIDKVSIRRYCTREGNHMYRCNVCGKTYTHISNFCRHFLSAHYGIKQDIHCPVCYKPFTRKDNMMTHAKQVHGVAVPKGVVASAESHCDLSSEFF